MKLRIGLLTALALVAVAGCGDSEPNGAEASDGELEVLTSFYPLQYATERVAGQYAAVDSLVPPGAEPHEFELSAREVARVGEADLVVYLSEFQPAIDEAVRSEAGETGFDVAPHARLLDVEATAGGDDHRHDDHAGESQPEGDDAGEGGDHSDNGHGNADPHFWLDPLRLADVADEIAGKLAELDPDHAEDYTANAEALRDDLTALDEDYTAALEGCVQPDLVTGHTAFGYLAERYGLIQVGIGGLAPAAEPNTQQIARISEYVRDHGVNTIYYETLVSPDVAKVIANETGARTAVLDPLEGLTDKSPGDHYLEIMRANLDTLVAHQPCS